MPENTINFPAPDFVANGAAAIISTCRAAWGEGFMSGFSGNASLRPEKNADIMLITGSGSPKGSLTPENFTLMTLEGEIIGASTARPSSESAMHAAIYRRAPECMAILHTHPPRMQALSLIISEGLSGMAALAALKNDFLAINLYESQMWRERLFYCAALAPGGAELAAAAAASLPQNARLPCAIWLANHGLCALAKNQGEALNITEEFNHLAKVQLMLLTKKNQGTLTS